MIRSAALSRRVINKAAKTARATGTTTLIIGILAVPVVLLSPSAFGAVIAGGICVIGAMELAGSRKMREADPTAATFLGRNQIAFLALICLYCICQMIDFNPESIKDAAVSPAFRNQLSAMPGSADYTDKIDSLIDRWAPVAIYGFYSLVIALSLACQGSLALYYFTRKRHLENYHTDNPEWVRRIFVETAA